MKIEEKIIYPRVSRKEDARFKIDDLIREKVIALRKYGYSWREITEETLVSPTTCKWIYLKEVEPEKFEQLRKRYNKMSYEWVRKNREKYRGYSRKSERKRRKRVREWHAQQTRIYKGYTLLTPPNKDKE